MPDKPQAQPHGHRQAQVLPGAEVVAGPDHGVALVAGEGRAADHQVALVGPQAGQPLGRGARHLRAVDVVGLAVGRAVAVQVKGASSGSISSSNSAGSFMSFQKPAMPSSSSPA